MRSSIALSVAIAMAMFGSVACGGSSREPQTSPPSPVEAKLDAAHAHERIRRYDLAEKEYRSAIAAARSARERAMARRELADALIFWGKYREAAEVFEALVSESPKIVAAWHDLGMVRQKLGDDTGAERALQRSIELGPHDPRSRIALAALLVNQRRLREAQAHYRRLLELELPPRLRRAVNKALDILARELGTPTTGP